MFHFTGFVHEVTDIVHNSNVESRTNQVFIKKDLRLFDLMQTLIAYLVCLKSTHANSGSWIFDPYFLPRTVRERSRAEEKPESVKPGTRKAGIYD